MKWLRFLPCLALVGCLAGCAFTVSDSSEYGIRYGTEIVVFSRAAQTSDRPAYAKADWQPLIDYLVKLGWAKETEGETAEPTAKPEP